MLRHAPTSGPNKASRFASKVLIGLTAKPGRRALVYAAVPGLAADINSELANYPRIDLENVFAQFATDNGTRTEGHRGFVDRGHPTGFVKEQHVERDARVLHPETLRTGTIENEQHSGPAPQVLSKHQALPSFLHRVRYFDLETGNSPAAAQGKDILLAGKCARLWQPGQDDNEYAKCRYQARCRVYDNSVW